MTSIYPLFSRQLSIVILLLIGSSFAANHVAARVAFNEGAGLGVALLARALTTFTILLTLTLSRQETISLKKGNYSWQLMLGILIALQSFCTYSAVARIPVAIALLIANTFPIALTLIYWLLSGRRPSKQTLLTIFIILLGLTFVLNLYGSTPVLSQEAYWIDGVLFAVGSAIFFGFALWITDQKLSTISGTVRSLYTISIVLLCLTLLYILLPSNQTTFFNLPQNATGWLALLFLCIFYTQAFITLFVFAPRLNMAENAPAMNIEPVSSLIFGWLILNQTFDSIQLIGGAIVLMGIVILTIRRS